MSSIVFEYGPIAMLVCGALGMMLAVHCLDRLNDRAQDAVQAAWTAMSPDGDRLELVEALLNACFERGKVWAYTRAASFVMGAAIVYVVASK